MWQSLIRLIESGVAGPPNKLFMAFFVGGSQKRHHDLYLLEMQNAKKSMAIKKKIALMSRLGVVRAKAGSYPTPPPPPRHTLPSPDGLRIISCAVLQRRARFHSFGVTCIFKKRILLPVFPSHSTIWKMANTNFLCRVLYGNIHNTSDHASPGFTRFRYMAPGTDWRFLPFWQLFANLGILATFWRFFGPF